MKSLSKFAILLAFQGSLPTKLWDYIDNLVTWNFRDIFISRFWSGHISRHLNFAILQNFILNYYIYVFLEFSASNFGFTKRDTAYAVIGCYDLFTFFLGRHVDLPRVSCVAPSVFRTADYLRTNQTNKHAKMKLARVGNVLEYNLKIEL